MSTGPRSGLPSRKALLLRVGMDRGTGGALGPICRDGTFEYIPIPESVATRCALTYATLPGRHFASLAAVLPARLAERQPHIDPDFLAATYGDAAPRKRRQLLGLNPGDLLVFYAGLAPRPAEDRPRLFAIGCLRVKQVHHLSSRDIGRRHLQQRFGQTAHFLRRRRDRDLALVEGWRQASRLFTRAVPLGDGRDCLLRDLVSFGYQGSLLRAVGHWIDRPRGLKSLEAWLRHGPASLVGEDTRLIPIDASTLHRAGSGEDLATEDREARVGDWIIALGEGDAAAVRALGRINRIVLRNGRGGAVSSLYWCFGDGGAVLANSALRALLRHRVIANPPLIRRLIGWFAAHYRIGRHLTEAAVSARRPFARG